MSEEQINFVKRIERSTSKYETLGIYPDANVEEIKKAYKIESLKVHPDKNHAPGSTAAFQKLDSAYRALLQGDSSLNDDESSEDEWDFSFTDSFFGGRGPFFGGRGPFFGGNGPFFGGSGFFFFDRRGGFNFGTSSEPSSSESTETPEEYAARKEREEIDRANLEASQEKLRKNKERQRKRANKNKRNKRH